MRVQTCRCRCRRRRGATVLEAALILIWLVVFMSASFEYSRLLFNWSLLNNAAREGCRYALTHNTSTTINSDVQGVVTSFMAGQTGNFSSFTVTVSGTHQGVSTPVNNLSPGDLIAVTVSGKYNYMNIIPLVPRPPALTITSTFQMVCEGGA